MFYQFIDHKQVYCNNWIKNGILNIGKVMDIQDNLVKYERFKERLKILDTPFLGLLYQYERILLNLILIQIGEEQENSTGSLRILTQESNRS